MCSKKSVRYIFRNIDVVIADTSVVMNTDALEEFIERYEDILRESRTRIIIPASVRKEIARLLGSENPEKMNKAQNCIGVLCRQRDLFAIEGGDLSQADLDTVHADPEIIAMMTIRRKRQRQLLLTNDRNLAADVYGLNNLQSCHGKPISVYYIDHAGYLKESDCMTESVSSMVKDQDTRFAEKLSFEQSTSIQDTDTSDIAYTMDSEDMFCVKTATDTRHDNGESGLFIIPAICMIAAGVAGGMYKHRHEIRTIASWITKRVA